MVCERESVSLCTLQKGVQVPLLRGDLYGSVSIYIGYIWGASRFNHKIDCRVRLSPNNLQQNCDDRVSTDADVCVDDNG